MAVEFKDRRIERENTYTMLQNKDGTVTLIPVTGQVYEEGTALNAQNLNANFKEINSQLEEKAKKSDLEVEKARIDLLTKVENGQTEGNTELLDIRVGTDGKEYETAGESVRVQINNTIEMIKNGLDAQKVVDTGFNKLDKSKIKVGYVTDKGIVDATNQSYRHSDYIAVKDGQYITPIWGKFGSETMTKASFRFVTFYDTNKKYHSGYIGDNSTKKSLLVTKDGYAVISWYENNQGDSGIILTDYEVSDSEIFPKLPYKKVIKNCFDELYGKKLMTFGDSIMAGDGNKGVGIGDILAKRYNMTLYDYSNGGATMGKTGSNDILDQIDVGIASGNIPDIILIDGGTNDIAKNGDNAVCGLGELVSSVYSTDKLADTSTFTGGMEMALFKLQNAFPKALIVYIRCHQMASRDESLQIQYGNRAIEICERWGVPVADIFKIYCSYLEVMRTNFLADFTHPNYCGYKKKYLPCIVSTIKENMLDFDNFIY